MTASDHTIRNVEELREIIGEPNPVTPVKIFSELDETMRSFIARSPFLVLSTSDEKGHQDVSPKGDAPGFVAIEDATTLLIPDRKGNRLIMGLSNLLVNPHVGVLILIPGTPETLRVNGSAELTRDPAICERLATRGQPALLAIRVRVEECFFHCAKAFLRSDLWKPASWPERYTISFGKMLASRMGADEKVAEVIDQVIAEDYRTNL